MFADVFVSTALSWLGAKEGDNRHKEIIDTYNAHKPLARGYALSYKDAWCAAFVSSISIQCGYTSIIPTECSCSKLIEKFKALDCYIEDESRAPVPGDIVFYDWEDNGEGDNKGAPNHVGIVAAIVDETFTVVEGNKNNSVDLRTMQVNGKYIRGYAVPAFDSYDAAPGTAKTYTIQKGDTLSKIAKRFGTTVNDLQVLNRSKLVNPDKINIGDTIVVSYSQLSEPPETPVHPERDFEEIGKRFCEFLKDIETLDSYTELIKLL